MTTTTIKRTVTTTKVTTDDEENDTTERRQQPEPAVSRSTTFVIENDPALWPKQLTLTVTDKEICSIVQSGPVLVKDKIFPKKQEGRRFTSTNYYIHVKNGEKINRSWLVYSEKRTMLCAFVAAYLETE